MSHNPEHRHRSLKIAAIATSCLIALILMEAGARLLHSNKDALFDARFFASWFNSQLEFDPYEIPSTEYGLHWHLKPNFKSDVQELRVSKINNGKFLSAEAVSSSTGGLRINSNGFRGKELATDTDKECCRILMLGDSVTFGLLDTDYPSIVEDELRQSGIEIEAINGGVEGYAVRNLGLEMARYIELSPNIVTILIGWNDLFSSNPNGQLAPYSPRLLWLIDKAVSNLSRFYRSDIEKVRQEYQKPRELNANDPMLEALDQYQPQALAGIEEMIDVFKEKGADVFLMTLPGLFHSNVEIDARSLSIGHLPTFSNNPLILIKLTQVYNERVRELSKSKNVLLIDLEKWSETELVPRSEYYIDSVHLKSQGLKKMARFIAESIKQADVPLGAQ